MKNKKVRNVIYILEFIAALIIFTKQGFIPSLLPHAIAGNIGTNATFFKLGNSFDRMIEEDGKETIRGNLLESLDLFANNNIFSLGCYDEETDSYFYSISGALESYNGNKNKNKAIKKHKYDNNTTVKFGNIYFDIRNDGIVPYTKGVRNQYFYTYSDSNSLAKLKRIFSTYNEGKYRLTTWFM